jgi:hypothetical protein
VRTAETQLRAIVDRVNKVTGAPAVPWTTVDGRNVSSIGNYHLSRAYGGVALHCMANEHGGVHDVFGHGHMPKAELAGLMYAFLKGFETARGAA